VIHRLRGFIAKVRQGTSPPAPLHNPPLPGCSLTHHVPAAAAPKEEARQSPAGPESDQLQALLFKQGLGFRACESFVTSSAVVESPSCVSIDGLSMTRDWDPQMLPAVPKPESRY
jgi:hypothetical protein